MFDTDDITFTQLTCQAILKISNGISRCVQGFTVTAGFRWPLIQKRMVTTGNSAAIMQDVERFTRIFSYYPVRIEPACYEPNNGLIADHDNTLLDPTRGQLLSNSV